MGTDGLPIRRLAVQRGQNPAAPSGAEAPGRPLVPAEAVPGQMAAVQFIRNRIAVRVHLNTPLLRTVRMREFRPRCRRAEHMPLSGKRMLLLPIPVLRLQSAVRLHRREASRSRTGKHRYLPEHTGGPAMYVRRPVRRQAPLLSGQQAQGQRLQLLETTRPKRLAVSTQLLPPENPERPALHRSHRTGYRTERRLLPSNPQGRIVSLRKAGMRTAACGSQGQRRLPA